MKLEKIFKFQILISERIKPGDELLYFNTPSAQNKDHDILKILMKESDKIQEEFFTN